MAGVRLSRGGRRQDKAARGQGPGRACNAAARGLAAHLLSCCASSEEERGESQRAPPPLTKNDFAVSVNGEVTFALLRASPALERKGDMLCGRCHAGRTPQKERESCADAEISILMQRNAEKK